MRKGILRWTGLAIMLFLGISCREKGKEKQQVELISGVESVEFSQLRVIRKHSDKDVVSVQLFVGGGTENFPKEKEGIEALALQSVISGGSLKTPGRQWHETLERLGAQAEAASGLDFSVISLKCPAQNFNAAWDLWVEAVMSPALRNEDFEAARLYLRSKAAVREKDPKSKVGSLAREMFFEGRNYGKNPLGTPESLERIGYEETAKYYRDFVLQKCRLTLVVAGKIPLVKIIDKLMFSLDGISAGNCSEILEAVAGVDKAEVRVEPRSMHLQYLAGVFPGPPSYDMESAAMEVGMSILNERLFRELNEVRLLSYSPGASYMPGKRGYNLVFASTALPNECVQALREELRRALRYGFRENEVQEKKETLLTQHLLLREGVEAQASELGASSVRHDYLDYGRRLKWIKALDKQGIDEVFRKYCHELAWVYLGDASKINRPTFEEPLIQKP